jgi:hypothetical protein
VYVRKGDESVKAETPDDLRPPKRAVPRSMVQVQRDLKALQNPYDFATAATKQMFKGREEEVEELLDAIESGTHVAVFGLQRIGKTSLVEETLLDRIGSREALRKSVLFASLDFQRVGTEYSNYRGLLAAMVRAIAETLAPQIASRRGSDGIDGAVLRKGIQARDADGVRKDHWRIGQFSEASYCAVLRRVLRVVSCDRAERRSFTPQPRPNAVLAPP